MDYVKLILSGVAGITLALVGLTFYLVPGVNEKATGIGIFVAILHSFVFWVLAAVLCALFFAASRLKNRIFRSLLFWTPIVLITAIGIGFAALLTFVLLGSH